MKLKRKANVTLGMDETEMKLTVKRTETFRLKGLLEIDLCHLDWLLDKVIDHDSIREPLKELLDDPEDAQEFFHWCIKLQHCLDKYPESD